MVPSALIEMSRSFGWKVIGSGLAEHLVALAGDELAVAVDLQRAVAGVALAARRLHDQEAVAVDRDVERIAGLLHRALAQIEPGRAVLHEADGPIGAHEIVRRARSA